MPDPAGLANLCVLCGFPLKRPFVEASQSTRAKRWASVLGAPDAARMLSAMDDTTTSVLSISGVTKRYDLRRVLRGVELELGAGEILLLLGANGAGKTTLISIISGRVRASEGEVSVLGTRAKPGSPSGASIGIVGHSPMLHPGLSVRDNLEWFAAALGIGEGKARVRDLLERFGAKGLSERDTGRLSRGEGQRVALVRAMLADPPLLLLDEPFTGLDEAGRLSLLAELGALREAGKAILLTTHETDLGASIATRVALLSKGKIESIETSEQARASGGVIERYRASLAPKQTHSEAKQDTST